MILWKRSGKLVVARGCPRDGYQRVSKMSAMLFIIWVAYKAKGHNSHQFGNNGNILQLK